MVNTTNEEFIIFFAEAAKYIVQVSENIPTALKALSKKVSINHEKHEGTIVEFFRHMDYMQYLYSDKTDKDTKMHCYADAKKIQRVLKKFDLEFSKVHSDALEKRLLELVDDDTNIGDFMKNIRMKDLEYFWNKELLNVSEAIEYFCDFLNKNYSGNSVSITECSYFGKLNIFSGGLKEAKFNKNTLLSAEILVQPTNDHNIKRSKLYSILSLNADYSLLYDNGSEALNLLESTKEMDRKTVEKIFETARMYFPEKDHHKYR